MRAIRDATGGKVQPNDWFPPSEPSDATNAA